jgi:4-aminobutyrate aminotransferase-like enzyme
MYKSLNRGLIKLSWGLNANTIRIRAPLTMNDALLEGSLEEMA